MFHALLSVAKISGIFATCLGSDDIDFENPLIYFYVSFFQT